LKTDRVTSDDCWCLWGTLNYNFCAYAKPSKLQIASNITKISDLPKAISLLGCPLIDEEGDPLLCSDEKALGNCYNKAYQCVVTETGRCDCN
jgi:hypothetical protein